MASGYNLLTKSNFYTKHVIEDFEKVLGPFPKSYQELILNYKTGYPSISINKDTEIIYKNDNSIYYIESFHSLVSCYDRMNSYDNSYGLLGNHRKYNLLPICTSGSSYQEYFLQRDSGLIYSLNPNKDLDVEIKIENFKIADSLNEFILGFEESTYDC